MRIRCSAISVSSLCERKKGGEGRGEEGRGGERKGEEFGGCHLLSFIFFEVI